MTSPEAALRRLDPKAPHPPQMHHPLPASLLLAALAVSCQSSEPSASPLTDGHAWSMTYEADAYSGTWQQAVSAESAPPVENEPQSEGEPGAQGMVLLECRILQCPQEDLARWTGKADPSFALEAPAGEILDFVARSRGDLVSAPKLLLRPGAGTAGTPSMTARRALRPEAPAHRPEAKGLGANAGTG